MKKASAILRYILLVNRHKIKYNIVCSVSRKLSVCVVSRRYHSMPDMAATISGGTLMRLDSLINIVSHK